MTAGWPRTTNHLAASSTAVATTTSTGSATRIELGVAERFVDTLRTLVDLVDDLVDVVVATRDRDDDYLVALARAHHADFIVTGDRDLLEWADQQPPVITPAAFETLLVAAD